MSLSPFSVKTLRPEVELIYLLHYRHKNHEKWCRAPEITTTLLKNRCAEVITMMADFKPGGVICSKLRMCSEKSPKQTKAASNGKLSMS